MQYFYLNPSCMKMTFEKPTIIHSLFSPTPIALLYLTNYRDKPHKANLS